MKLAAQDRQALIRLASSLRPGSSERRAILAGLSKASVIPQDLPDFETLEKGLRGLTKRYRSIKEANASLDALLSKYGLRVIARKNVIPGHRKSEEHLRLFLQTDYGANIHDPLLVIHEPSLFLKTVNFQVSF